MELPKIAQEELPKGKRSVRSNIWGNLVGYVGGKRWEEFGDCYSVMNNENAQHWIKTGERLY